jgi:diaminopimelate decarboxylase
MTTALPVPTLAAGPAGLTLEGSPSPTSPRASAPPPTCSRAALTGAYEAYQQALGMRKALVCYAVKANSSLGILSVFAKLGAGFDIVSGGELARVLAAGGDPGKVIFSGVGKSVDEMRFALETASAASTSNPPPSSTASTTWPPASASARRSPSA